MADSTMVCPKCGKKIQITAALTAQIEEKIREESAAELSSALKAKDREWQEKLGEERATIEKKIRREAEERVKTDLKDLKEQVEEKVAKIEAMRHQELKLRKRERELEDQKAEMQIEMDKKLAQERARITREVSEKQAEANRLKELEKDRLIETLKGEVSDMKRKLEQGSQQAQGEVMEIDLEQNLRGAFPFDNIEPVEKGVKGADITQRVSSEAGRPCGTILWECKRTKNWSDTWVQKVKDDQRQAKADIAVIVSEVLPKDVKTFGFYDGVWVAAFPYAIGLAAALRSGLVREALVRGAQVGKDQKMEALFTYLTGPEFKGRVEAILEPFVAMREDLEKEKRSAQAAWAKREKQLNRVIDNTAGMYGDLKGIVGKSLPEMELLEGPDGARADD